VLAAEKMLVKIIERVRFLYDASDVHLVTHSPLDYVLGPFNSRKHALPLEEFCRLDDDDVLFAIKRWSTHPDIVLRTLCQGLLNRRLFKCRLQTDPVEESEVAERRTLLANRLSISEEAAAFLAFTGEAVNTTYKLGYERINILLKDGFVKDISKVDNPLIHQTLSTPVKKFYFCTMA
jgi:hypothetical protein